MDKLRKIAIIGKVFSDAETVYINVLFNNIEYKSLKAIHMPNKNIDDLKKQTMETYPIVEFDIPSEIIGNSIPLTIKILSSKNNIDFFFKKIKGTRMLRYGVMGETLENLFINTAHSDGKSNVFVDGDSVEISDDEWKPYIHKTRIKNDDCLECIKINRGDWIYKFNSEFVCDVAISGDYGITPINPTPTKEGITLDGETIILSI